MIHAPPLDRYASYAVIREFVTPLIAREPSLAGCVFAVGPIYDPDNPNTWNPASTPGVTGVAESWLTIHRKSDGFTHHQIIRRNALTLAIDDASRAVHDAARLAIPDADFSET